MSPWPLLSYCPARSAGRPRVGVASTKSCQLGGRGLRPRAAIAGCAVVLLFLIPAVGEGQDCELLQNGNFDAVTAIPQPCGTDPFAAPCNTVQGWTNACGSPQVSQTGTVSAPSSAWLWTSGQGRQGPQVVGEAIAAPVAVVQGQPLRISFWARSNGPVDWIDVGLTNAQAAGFPRRALNCNAPIPGQAPQPPRLGNSPQWQQFSFCITADNNYDRLYLRPRQNPGSGTFWAGFDDVSITVDPTCLGRDSSFQAPDRLCEGKALELTGTETNPYIVHQWHLNPTTPPNVRPPIVYAEEERCWGHDCTMNQDGDLAPGWYVVKHGTYASCVPWEEERQLVEVVGAPEVDAGPDVAICKGEGIKLPRGNCSFPAAPEFTWTPATGLLSPDGLCVKAAPEQSTTYTLTAINTAGCSASDRVRVEVGDVPTVQVETEESCCDRRLRAAASRADRIEWSNGSAASTIPAPDGGTYTVVATNECGSDTDSVTLGEKTVVRGDFPPILYPNAFRPNREDFQIFELGKNQGAQPAYGATAYRLSVFDRTGTEHLVAQDENCAGFGNGEIRWDGRINGNLVKEDTYNWILELKNCKHTHWTRRLQHVRPPQRVCKRTRWSLWCLCRRCVEWEDRPQHLELASEGAVTVVY